MKRGSVVALAIASADPGSGVSTPWARRDTARRSADGKAIPIRRALAESVLLVGSKIPSLSVARGFYPFLAAAPPHPVRDLERGRRVLAEAERVEHLVDHHDLGERGIAE